MIYDVRVEQHPGSPLAVVRRQARPQELSTVIPEACGTVWNTLKERNITGAGRNIALYLDDTINLEVGVELVTPLEGQGGIVASTTPAGRVAIATHFGPYARLGEAHQAIRRWCVDHDYLLAGPNWEIYGHWEKEWTDNPDKIQTDVHYLLGDPSP